MPSEFPRSPKLIKGALVELSDEFLGPVPNVIVFQYNPENLTRTLDPWKSGKKKGEIEQEGRTQAFDPGETFDLTLDLDATDALEEPDSHPVAVISGVADRIAALEMLLYPPSASVVGQAIASLGGAADVVPRKAVPIVLFVWGAGRILPVRLTSFKVEEEAFSPTLFPIRAKVTVGLRVLTPEAIKDPAKPLSAGEEIAILAYEFTLGQKEILARANLANSAEGILGMLPF